MCGFVGGCVGVCGQGWGWGGITSTGSVNYDN